MEIEFITFLGINSGLVVILFALTRARVFRIFAASALNPLMVFCLLAIIFNIDFCVVWSNPYIDFTEYVSSIPPTTVVQAYGVFTVLFSATFLGLTGAVVWWSRRLPVASIYPPSRPDVAAQRSAKTISLIVCAAALLNLPVYLSYNLSEYAYVVYGREHIWATLVTWLVPPTVAVFVAHHHHRPALSIAICIIAVNFMYVAGGGRGFVLLVISVLAISYATYKRISPLWFAVFFPVLGLYLAFFRYAFREIGKYASYADFINQQGGYIALFFGSEEVSFAKMFAMTYEVAPPTGMFESFAALLALPLPRQFFPEKPLGASAYFTQYISPTRWDLTQSESLVTGFGDMYWHFGFAAVPLLFAIAFSWLWLCIRVINTSRESTILCIPLLNFGMFTFMRGDVFNVGLILWPALIVIVAFKFLGAVFRHDRERIGSIGSHG